MQRHNLFQVVVGQKKTRMPSNNIGIEFKPKEFGFIQSRLNVTSDTKKGIFNLVTLADCIAFTQRTG